MRLRTCPAVVFAWQGGEDAVIVFSLLTHISSSPSNNREGVFGIITCSVSLFSQNSAPSSSKLSEARAVRV